MLIYVRPFSVFVLLVPDRDKYLSCELQKCLSIRHVLREQIAIAFFIFRSPQYLLVATISDMKLLLGT